MEALIQFLEKPNLFSFLSTKLACRNNVGWRSGIYVEVMSADYSRMREIEGVRIVELVYVGGLLRMGGDYLLLPVWRSVGGDFTVKGELEVWVDWSRLNLGAQRGRLTCWLTWVAA